MHKIQYILLIILSLGVMSCGHNRRDYFADTALTPVHLNIYRFDSALLAIDTTNLYASAAHLQSQYPVFTSEYRDYILGFRGEDSLFWTSFSEFLNDTTYHFREINAYEQQVYTDITPIRTELETAFTRLHALFPDAVVPDIYFFVSGFVTPMYITDSILAVGADLYLGSDYPYYNTVVNEYQKTTMNPDYLSGDVLSAYLFRNIPFASTKNRLLDYMIYNGKIMFLLAQLLPTHPDHMIIGYTEDQIDWCLKYESDIWRCIMDKRDLFNTDNVVLTSYIKDGPFTSEVSQDSPGRLGMWVGWRIVSSYMEHNPEITLTQLLDEHDAQRILQNSQYQP